MSIVLVTVLSLAILVVGFVVGWLVGGIGATLSSLAFLSLLTLVVGFLVGWLVEWVIDSQYRRIRELSQPAASAQSEAGPGSAVEAADMAQTIRQMFYEREEEVDGLRQDLRQQEARYDVLEEQFEQYVTSHPDDLTAIRGVGRIFQWKLRDGGYSTFAQLAGADADQLRQLLDIRPWHKADPQEWIDQAKGLAHRGVHGQEA
jgi:predicted flap endonuclease-1-like 5' DNA nuclease